MTQEPDQDHNQEPASGKGNIVGVLFVVALLAAVIWLAHALYANLQLQKCQIEGRRDCVDVPQPSQ